MKRIPLFLIATLIIAAPAFAVPIGQLPTTDTTPKRDVPSGHHRPADLPDASGGGGDDQPTAPVPEPGTIALAAMSAAAIGGALHKRRNKQK